MGRQAAAALAMFAADQNDAGGIQIGAERRAVVIECLDDQSNPRLCAELYRSLCYENQADVIFGPYSSDLTRVAAPIAEQAGRVLINHGGADDSLYRKKVSPHRRSAEPRHRLSHRAGAVGQPA